MYLVASAVALGVAGCGEIIPVESCGDGVVSGVEECDDGNTVDGDGCSSLCEFEYFCGDGVVADGEECDDGNTVDGDGCSSTCQVEYCGDGVVQPATEECDSTLDCEPSCVFTPCAFFGVPILDNSGFESGVLDPWTTNGPAFAGLDAYHGTWGATVHGNFYLQQEFAPVPVAALTRAAFRTWHDPEDSPAMAVTWTYSDGAQGSQFYSGAQLAGWVEIDVQPLLDVGRQLVALQVWGYSGGGNAPDISHFDAFAFCR